MQKYTNSQEIDPFLAVFLATDNYDYDATTVSATRLLKSTRQLVLSKRVPEQDAVVDIAGLLKARVGNAVHSGVENAWLNNYESALADLGYPQGLIKKIKLNPTEKEVESDPNMVPIYLEQRFYKELNGFKISGMVDFIADGEEKDLKTTSTFTYSNGVKYKDYQLQGSIYRWLAPDIITSDFITIQYIFTDWVGYKLKSEKNYPPSPTHFQRIPLLSLQETEAYITNKLNEYTKYLDLPENKIPLCTPEELWMDDPVWKYYKNPEKTSGRSTKNFDDEGSAYNRLSIDGNVGVVIKKEGNVTACKYCSAFSECTQKDGLIASGKLVLNK